MSRSHRFLLIAICGTAGLLRVWHIDFGLPHDFHPDEPQIITTSLSMLIQQDLNPHFFTWPGLVFYLNAVLYSVLFLVGKMLGFFPSMAELQAFELLDRSVFILISRLLSALFGSLSVIPLFVLGRHLGHARVGLMAAAVLAVSPVHVWNSHFGTVDIALTFFILAASYFLYVSYRQQRKRDFILLGVCAGLATATKYPAGLLLIAIVLLSPLFVAKEEQPLWSRSFLLSSHSPLVLSLGAFILSYSLAAPYTFLDFSAFWQEFGHNSLLLSQGWLGSEGGNSYFGYYAKLLLVDDWGIFTGFLCLIGTAMLAFQSPRTALVLLTFPVLYYGFFGLSAIGFARFALPLVPTVALLAAYAVWQISRLGLQISPRMQTVILLVGTLMMVWPGASQTLRANEKFGKPDTREISQAWIEEHIPMGSVIVMEYYGPPLLDPHQSKAETMARQRLSRHEIWRPWLSRHVPVAKPFYYATIIPIADPLNPEAVATEFYDFSRYVQNGIGYFVSDSNLSSRYKAAAQKYPRQVAFYKDLEQHCELVQTWNPHELNGTGPEIRLYRIPQSLPETS